MDLFEHFKETYHKENERTKIIQDGLTIPIGIISVLTTLITFYLFNFNYFSFILVVIIFIGLVASGSIFIVLGVVNIYKAYNITTVNPSLSYRYLPVAKEQENYLLELREYYKKEGLTEKDVEANAMRDFKDYLQEFYVKSATNNTDINLTTNDFLTKSKGNTFIALILLISAGIPYGINYAYKPENINKFEIIKSVPLQLDSNTIKTLKHG